VDIARTLSRLLASIVLENSQAGRLRNRTLVSESKPTAARPFFEKDVSNKQVDLSHTIHCFVAEWGPQKVRSRKYRGKRCPGFSSPSAMDEKNG